MRDRATLAEGRREAVAPRPVTFLRRWGRTAGGGVALWAGVVVFGGTTALLLAVLGRHPEHASFTGLSALLGLAFACSLVPAGLQLRCASLVADGQPVPRMSRVRAFLLIAAALVASPVLGIALHLPGLAVAFIVLQTVAGIVLARIQGAMLAFHRFLALGVNQFIEGVARALLGIVLGLTWGLTGLALAMFVSTVVAIIALPPRPPIPTSLERPTTSLLHTSLALALLGVYIQLDVLLAPSALSARAATTYDLAAVPSKGVYLVLVALGPLLFPFIRRRSSRKLILGGAAATLALGLVVSAVLVALRPVIATVLGQAEPSTADMAMLTIAMSLAGVTSVVVNAAIAHGVARPWPPIALGMVALVICSRLGGVTWFAAAGAVIQLLVAVASLWIVIRGKLGESTRAASVPTTPERSLRRRHSREFLSNATRTRRERRVS